MAEVLTQMFNKSTRVLVKDGKFNKVQGDYYHDDHSQRSTNNGCYNMIGNTIHNVGNICPQVIHHERGVHSMHHAASGFATGLVAIVDASVPNTAPQSQVPVRNGPLLYSVQPSPQSPGKYLYTQPGDIRPMHGLELGFMTNQMAQMSPEIDSEFCVDHEEQNDTSEDESSSTRGPPSLSPDFNRLTIGECVSSPRSALIHGLSFTAAEADKSPKHIIISGDHTEVDDKFYQFNFNSNKVANNIIEDSFGEGA